MFIGNMFVFSYGYNHQPQYVRTYEPKVLL